MLDIPYFMQNDDWYYFDGEKYVLTNNAPEKAKISLVDFYKQENNILREEKRK